MVWTAGLCSLLSHHLLRVEPPGGTGLASSLGWRTCRWVKAPPWARPNGVWAPAVSSDAPGTECSGAATAGQSGSSGDTHRQIPGWRGTWRVWQSLREAELIIAAGKPPPGQGVRNKNSVSGKNASKPAPITEQKLTSGGEQKPGTLSDISGWRCETKPNRSLGTGVGWPQKQTDPELFKGTNTEKCIYCLSIKWKEALADGAGRARGGCLSRGTEDPSSTQAFGDQLLEAPLSPQGHRAAAGKRGGSSLCRCCVPAARLSAGTQSEPTGHKEAEWCPQTVDQEKGGWVCEAAPACIVDRWLFIHLRSFSAF